MTQGIEVTTHTGPIRSCGQIRVRALVTPITVKVLGTPGPQGASGNPGPQGLQGPPGNLDVGITIDGGNF